MPEAARAAVAPALWLLGRAADGVALTQTGALNRALVRSAVEEWPGWWDADLHGLPHREDDVEAGWHSEDGPITLRSVTWAVADVLRAAEAIGILGRAPGSRRHTRASLALTEAGRSAAIAGLRARALAPGVGPY